MFIIATETNASKTNDHIHVQHMHDTVTTWRPLKVSTCTCTWVWLKSVHACDSMLPKHICGYMYLYTNIELVIVKNTELLIDTLLN